MPRPRFARRGQGQGRTAEMIKLRGVMIAENAAPTTVAVAAAAELAIMVPSRPWRRA